MLKSGVKVVDHHLGNHRHHRDRQVRVGKRILQRALEHVSDRSFGVGDTYIQRLGAHLRRGELRSQQLRADLRPIAMGQHQEIAMPNKLHEMSRSHGRIRALLSDRTGLTGAKQRIAANRDQGKLRHRYTITATNRPLPTAHDEFVWSSFAL